MKRPSSRLHAFLFVAVILVVPAVAAAQEPASSTPKIREYLRFQSPEDLKANAQQRLFSGEYVVLEHPSFGAQWVPVDTALALLLEGMIRELRETKSAVTKIDERTVGLAKAIEEQHKAASDESVKRVNQLLADLPIQLINDPAVKKVFENRLADLKKEILAEVQKLAPASTTATPR